jgi:hypothetical protein
MHHSSHDRDTPCLQKRVETATHERQNSAPGQARTPGRRKGPSTSRYCYEALRIPTIADIAEQIKEESSRSPSSAWTRGS